VLLLVLGGLAELIYVYFFVRPYPLLRYYATPLLDLGKIAGRSRLSAAAFATAFLLLFALYYIGYRLCFGQDSPHWPWTMLAFTTIFSLTLLFVYPIGAADIFDYIIHGRILAHYRLNPFVHTASEFPNDPLTPYVAWRNIPSVYGPLWACLDAGTNFLAGSADLLANLWAFKVLAIFFYILDTGLIYSILAEIRPAYALPGAFLFAWNPLLLFETAANGHNDSVMMFCTLLAIFLLLKRKPILSIIALICSAMIKFITIILWPFFLVSLLALGESKASPEGESPEKAGPGEFQEQARRSPLAIWLSSPEWRRRGTSLLVYSLVSFGIMALFYAPFWTGWGTIPLRQRLGMFTNSLPTLIMLLLRIWLDVGQARRLVGWLSLAALGFFGLTRWVRLASQKSDRMAYHDHGPLILASLDMILFYLLFTCTWLQPWYLVWLVALAALVPDLDTAHQAVLFTYTMTWAYVVYQFVWFWYIPAMNWMNRLGVHSLAVGATLVAPWAFSAYLLWKRRNSSRRQCLRGSRR